MVNIAIAKAYARRLYRNDIMLEEVKAKVPSDMYQEIVRQLEALQTA